MDSAHEKLLEDFEEFEFDLEVEKILKKVKREWVGEEDQLIAFAEYLKELEPGLLPPTQHRVVHPGP